MMPSKHLILCLPLLLPSIFLNIRVFSNESALCIRWPKYWTFSFSISPSNEYSGLISFRIDWFDLLAVQGSLKSLLQHHSSKASILQHSVFPAELFKIFQDDAVKMLCSICQQIWKTQQWQQDWKRSVSIPSQRKATPKNAQITSQLHSSHC